MPWDGIGDAGVERVHMTSHGIGDDIEPAWEIFLIQLLVWDIHKAAGVCWQVVL